MILKWYPFKLIHSVAIVVFLNITQNGSPDPSLHKFYNIFIFS